MTRNSPSAPPRAPTRRTLFRRSFFTAVALATGALCTVVQPLAAADLDSAARQGNGLKRITAWGTSQQPNTTPVPITNATVRMIARVTIPGEYVSFRLDNTFGATAVTIGKAHIGPRIQGALLAAGLNRQAYFGGSPSVTIPAGGSVYSDPVPLRVFAQQDLAVSLYVPGSNVLASQHGGAVVTSYRSADGTGDVAADETRTPYTLTTTSTLWLKSIDVWSRSSTGAVVAFGDSITDGTCTTLDAHDRWEDLVAVRLDTPDRNGFGRLGNNYDLFDRFDRRADGHKSIVNEGIGGNTVLRAGLQPPPDSTPGVERLDRDVLSHSGVTHVILFMGTNDIRREATATSLIGGMTDIARRIKAAGHKVIGVTIVPRHNVAASGTNTGWNDAKTVIRNQVNQWIRTTRVFDDVIDFDRVVRDPADPNLLYPAFNCGDGIHPSPAGYYQMGKSVDLDMLESGKR